MFSKPKIIFELFFKLILIYFCLRLIFYFNNLESYSLVQNKEIFFGFLNGIRFDLVSISLTNALFFLLLFLPYKFWTTKKYYIVKAFFWIFNLFFLAVNVGDSEYFKFNGKRVTWSVFYLASDVKNQSIQLITYYWPLFSSLLVLTFLLWKSFPKIETLRSDQENKNILNHFTQFFIFSILLIIGMRGGLQLKPLKMSHAFNSSNEFTGHLALNSTFTILKSRSRSLYEVEITKNLINEIGNVNINQVSWSHHPNNYNVIIIILESFSLEFIGAANNGNGYTPFLDTLIEKSVFLKNGFANGRRSIESLPSILSSIPSWLSEPFVTSEFSSNQVYGIGTALKQYGYSTSFFHGAENGTMYFDSYSKRAGFDQYFGLNEYPDKNDFDGNWGIYDEPFFQYTISKLSEMKEPFASVVFSLSSHQPYSVPDKYKEKFKKGDLEIHESIAYTDYSLKSFFENASKKKWFDKTLFVITADHTTKSSNSKYQNFLGSFRVPIIFYSPTLKIPQINLDKITQHIDIPLSILDLLKIRPLKWSVFGQSVFQANQGWAMNPMSTSWWLALDKGALLWVNSDESHLYNADQLEPILNEKSSSEEMQFFKNEILKSRYLFNQSMTENALIKNVPEK